MEKKAEVTNWKQKIRKQRKQRKENISLTNLNTGNIGISNFWILAFRDAQNMFDFMY